MEGLEGITRIVGPTILTVGGSYFDFDAPERSEFTVDDIAHALANICRFTGHTRHFYSVAEHSVHCSFLVSPRDALAALLHDAPEAFIGDVSRPLKSLLPDFRAIEKRVEAAVLRRFGLAAELPASVKLADRQMLLLEQGQAMGNGDRWADLDGLTTPDMRLQFYPPIVAKQVFLNRYEQLRDA